MNWESSGISLCRQSVDNVVNKITEGVITEGVKNCSCM